VFSVNFDLCSSSRIEGDTVQYWSRKEKQRPKKRCNLIMAGEDISGRAEVILRIVLTLAIQNTCWNKRLNRMWSLWMLVNLPIRSRSRKLKTVTFEALLAWKRIVEVFSPLRLV